MLGQCTMLGLSEKRQKSWTINKNLVVFILFSDAGTVHHVRLKGTNVQNQIKLTKITFFLIFGDAGTVHHVRLERKMLEIRKNYKKIKNKIVFSFSFLEMLGQCSMSDLSENCKTSQNINKTMVFKLFGDAGTVHHVRLERKTNKDK